MSATELAWAAGFFDGEGTTHLSSTYRERSDRTYGPYHQLFVSVQQSGDLHCLVRFQAAIGGFGRIYALTPRPGLAKKPQFRWQTNSRAEGMAALGAMWLYLSEPKRRQANGVLRTLRNNRAVRVSARTAQSTPEGASS